MRTVVLCFLLFLSSSCARDSVDPAPPVAAPPAASRAGAPLALPRAAPFVATVVRGVVVTDLGEPIVARAVKLLDDRGSKFDGRTDAKGAFVIENVLPPYDLAIDDASSAGPTVYLGVHREDPYLELFERSGPTPGPDRQKVRVGLRVPSCGSSSCWITLLTASDSGAGVASATWQPGDADVLVTDVDHGWRVGTLPPGELLSVHVLVGDEERTAFAYGHLDGVVASPGETRDVGMIAMEPLQSTPPATFGARDGSDGGLGWSWRTEVSLVLPDRGVLVLARADAPSLSTPLPLLPGAMVRVNVAGVHPHAGAGGGFHRSLETWSGSHPLGFASCELPVAKVEVDVGPGPEPARPIVDGNLSRRGLGLAWKGSAAPALAVATVADVTRGRRSFRVFTDDEEISLARLSLLGLPKLVPGNHELDLTTRPASDVDEATSPALAKRRRRDDPAHRGVATRIRVPFQVTP